MEGYHNKYERLSKYFSEYGIIPLSNALDPYQVKIGRWASNQTKDVVARKLSDEKVHSLQHIICNRAEGEAIQEMKEKAYSSKQIGLLVTEEKEKR